MNTTNVKMIRKSAIYQAEKPHMDHVDKMNKILLICISVKLNCLSAEMKNILCHGFSVQMNALMEVYPKNMKGMTPALLKRQNANFLSYTMALSITIALMLLLSRMTKAPKPKSPSYGVPQEPILMIP